MGAGYSSQFSLEEKNKPFRLSSNVIDAIEYRNHVKDDPHTSVKAVVFPTELTAKVTLYQDVDLSFNLIQDFPSTLPLTLPHLTTLNLSHNLISILPDSIYGLMHLEHLDVSYNRLNCLPDTIIHLDRLATCNLSNNIIKSLPTAVDKLQNLSKLNVSSNKLEHLPIALGNLPKLSVILANDNEFLPELKVLCEAEDCQPIITHLRDCYNKSRASDMTSHQIQQFPRERGQLFQSKILKAGSAQSFFYEMQGQAVNTGNRLLTPLIPPPSTSKLDLERFKDSVLGMFYGAVVGDSLGLLTDFLTPCEAAFYYDRNEFLQQPRMHVDKHRCHFKEGDVTFASHLLLIVLDSVLKWAGVLDELDYAGRLASFMENYDRPVVSQVLQGMGQIKDFKEDPSLSARSWLETSLNLSEEDTLLITNFKDTDVTWVPDDSNNIHLVCDNACLPPMIGLVVSQFYDLKEIESNAARICSSTHAHKDNKMAGIFLAKLLAQLLQGCPVTELTKEWKAKQVAKDLKLDPSHTWVCVAQLCDAVQAFADHQTFHQAIIDIVMKGGHASVNGCVSGAVIGLLAGFHAIPKMWIERLDPAFRKVLDKKLNNLLDNMAIP